MRKTFLVVLLAVALVSAACGGDGFQPGGDEARDEASFDEPYSDAEAYPLFVSSEIVVGENRFLVGLLNDEDAPIGSPDIDMHIDFFDLDRSTEQPVVSADPRFVWIEEPFRGLYVARVNFDRAGKWGAEVTVEGDGLKETMRGSFEVRDEPHTPAIGDRVPASDTPTADDVNDLSEISSDDDPEPRFYRHSIADALTRENPFVVTFATPKFCQTAACAPMWDIVKGVARTFPRMTFIHVEPYDLDKIPEFEPVDAAVEWGLPTEPWVFVVDSRGRVAAKYEGLLDPTELRAALEALR